MSHVDKTEDHVSKLHREYQDHWNKYAEALERGEESVKVHMIAVCVCSQCVYGCVCECVCVSVCVCVCVWVGVWVGVGWEGIENVYVYKCVYLPVCTCVCSLEISL